MESNVDVESVCRGSCIVLHATKLIKNFYLYVLISLSSSRRFIHHYGFTPLRCRYYYPYNNDNICDHGSATTGLPFPLPPKLPPSPPIGGNNDDNDPIPIRSTTDDSLLNAMIDEAYKAGQGMLHEGKALLQTVKGEDNHDVLMDDETGHKKRQAADIEDNYDDL